ncbi:DUF4867 family protein [Virgibacillus sp. YIM 98842]|uniref:DUF4867 family protein n=1 Tax=Virgibacillus sp. YIM 98842 TaxID=2663533 RepID=UPI0013DD2862|nr:DUF4867 family protein [Virgibacillus sp. YIM 98842]
MIEELKAHNPLLTVMDVREDAFKIYGKVLEDFPFSKVNELMENIDIPKEGNVYVATEQILEDEDLKSFIEKRYYGGMDIQVGYCNGKNSNLNGVEYHKGSEINVAITDFVLLLGHVNDIQEGSFSVKDVKGFYVPAGTAIEIYQTTLHLSPCKTSDKGFKCVVVLPRGTNDPISDEEKEFDERLFMKNKWLLAHPENERFRAAGAYVGIKGENITVRYPSK